MTGGTRGIGRAIALALADRGAVVAVASRSAEACARVAQELVARGGGRALGVGCDAASEASVHALFDRVEDELGGTDVFVHCAGASSVANADDVARAELQRMLDVHLLGAMTGAQRACASMRARGGGAVLMVTSIWGLGGAATTVAYGAAKAALAHTVKVLAIEWARYGIRVNGIAPGFVETDMTAEVDPGVRDKLLRKIPMRRAATPDEIAGPAIFLCSDAASYVTGQILVVDGGERAR